MREVDAASSVAIMETNEAAESWHSSFPIHLGGLYPFHRHCLYHKGQWTPSRPTQRKKSPSALQLHPQEVGPMVGVMVVGG